VTRGADACPVRRGAAPEVLAALRNAVLTLLDAAGVPTGAAARRAAAGQPGTALRLLGSAPRSKQKTLTAPWFCHRHNLSFPHGGRETADPGSGSGACVCLLAR
jgi:hypothetical protein